MSFILAVLQLAYAVYIGSATFDIAPVVDGNCVLHPTPVTVTGASLGGRTTIGMTYVPPEGITITAKVSGANTVKVEACNWSGTTYDPPSATYYLGVTQ